MCVLVRCYVRTRIIFLRLYVSATNITTTCDYNLANGCDAVIAHTHTHQVLMAL